MELSLTQVGCDLQHPSSSEWIAIRSSQLKCSCCEQNTVEVFKNFIILKCWLFCCCTISGHVVNSNWLMFLWELGTAEIRTQGGRDKKCELSLRDAITKKLSCYCDGLWRLKFRYRWISRCLKLGLKPLIACFRMPSSKAPTTSCPAAPPSSWKPSCRCRATPCPSCPTTTAPRSPTQGKGVWSRYRK